MMFPCVPESDAMPTLDLHDPLRVLSRRAPPGWSVAPESTDRIGLSPHASDLGSVTQ